MSDRCPQGRDRDHHRRDEGPRSELFNFEFVRQQLEDRLNAQLVPGMTSEQMDALIAQTQLDMQLLEAQLDQPDALIP